MYILFLPQLSNLKVTFFLYHETQSCRSSSLYFRICFFNVNINCTKQFLPGRQMLPIYKKNYFRFINSVMQIEQASITQATCMYMSNMTM